MPDWFSVTDTINLRELNKRIRKFTFKNKYDPDIYMNRKTMEAVMDAAHMKIKNPYYIKYNGCMIHINSGFKYGEIKLK